MTNLTHIITAAEQQAQTMAENNTLWLEGEKVIWSKTHGANGYDIGSFDEENQIQYRVQYSTERQRFSYHLNNVPFQHRKAFIKAVSTLIGE